MNIPEILLFVLLSLLGGIAYVLIEAEEWADLKSFKTVRHIMISSIVGVIYYNLYSEWDFPNMVMSFVSGYMGPTFIQGLLKKLGK